ncbi:MAG: hypothetical protein GY851_26635 [bacterium]|nr:hypothetical protein [bacterium]
MAKSWHVVFFVAAVTVSGCAATNAVHKCTRTPCNGDACRPIEKAYLTGNNHLIVCFAGTITYRGERRDGRHHIDVPLHLYQENEPNRRRRYIELSRRRIAPGWPADSEVARRTMEEIPIRLVQPPERLMPSGPLGSTGEIGQREDARLLAFAYLFERAGRNDRLEFRLRPYDVEHPMLAGAALVPAGAVDIVTAPIQFLGAIAYLAQGQP